LLILHEIVLRFPPAAPTAASSAPVLEPTAADR
jgi:hypothetical protein